MFWTVYLGAAPAILNVVMAYLVRSEGAALHASIGTMSGCLLNIVLDPVFILPWGLNMGAAGAGLATFLSNCAACLYFFVLLYIKRGNTFVCIDPRKFRLKKRIIIEVCGVGIPASIQNLLNVTGMTILNRYTYRYTGLTPWRLWGSRTRSIWCPCRWRLDFHRESCRLSAIHLPQGI